MITVVEVACWAIRAGRGSGGVGEGAGLAGKAGGGRGRKGGARVGAGVAGRARARVRGCDEVVAGRTAILADT